MAALNTDLFITRKRRWETIAENDAAATFRDGLMGAVGLMILVVLVAVYFTS